MPGSSSTTRITSPFTLVPPREGETEPCSGAGRGVDDDRAAVGLDDRLADREADATRRAALAPPEGLEDALGLEGRYARPFVFHPGLHHVPCGPRADAHDGARRRVACRVLEQVA